MLAEGNPVTATLRESREEVTALNELLCRKGFWSTREAEKMIAETEDDFTSAPPFATRLQRVLSACKAVRSRNPLLG
jgi:hypothetical protein